MHAHLRSIDAACLHGAETDTRVCPQIVGTLMEQGYPIDFRSGDAVYDLPDGDDVVPPIQLYGVAIAHALRADSVQDEIREAQALATGYTYAGFCSKVMKAGCTGYMLSFSGRRAVYFGRTAGTHIEHFPR